MAGDHLVDGHHGAAMMLSNSIQTMIPNDDRFASSAIRDLLHHARREDIISLAGGLPAPELLPADHLGPLYTHVLDTVGSQSLQYGVTAGEPALRGLLALEGSGDPDRIVVTSGSQQALDLCLAALRPAHRAAIAVMEEPGYLGALQVLQARTYELSPVPVDQDGLCVDILEDRLRNGLAPTLCYVNPTFQNPTGASLSRERAHALVDLAEQYGFIVIADDPYRELYFDEHRPPDELRDSDMVIRLGSFSKTLAPGLRIGWLDAHQSVVARVERAKQAADLHTSTINQLVVAEAFGDKPWWNNHLDDLRTRYRLRREALSDALTTHLPHATLANQAGGFFWWTRLEGMNTDTFLTTCLAMSSGGGTAFVPGSAFHSGAAPSDHLRLSYSTADPTRFDEAVQRLANAMERAPAGKEGN